MKQLQWKMHSREQEMKVSVAYSNKRKKVWLKVEVPESATVKEVIDNSGILEQFPDIDLEQQKVGIFGKLTKLDALVEEGNRIEIYRPITADPESVERRDR
jgi:putative ubiquitin-RnfH superfamily antitoxin RatB of RatAB toxin-antitoxin module